ncbi:MAG: SpoIID/LytB domain-containing protein [Clostridium sp.]|jgi:stage II sporulation protein D|nr:SpoIID/LytB domain-containing protein [Clostridium sp.]
MSPFFRKRRSTLQTILSYRKQHLHQPHSDYQKTIRLGQGKPYGMVLCLCILLPYILSIFWSDKDGQEPQRYLATQVNSRIMINVGVPAGLLKLSMEEYLYGALAASIPAEYEPETLKAQAILLRSSIIKQYREQVTEGARAPSALTMNDPSYCSPQERMELWGDQADNYEAKIRQAVNETRGIYITHEGAPIHGLYCLVSAGSTRSFEAYPEALPSYIKVIDCPRDYLSEDYLSEIVYSNERLEKRVGGSIGEFKTDAAGYCVSVTIYPPNAEATKRSGEWLRAQLDLPSANFSLVHEDNQIRFFCKGNGHGFGMSQFAANELAISGGNYESILTQFFSDVEFDKYE